MSLLSRKNGLSPLQRRYYTLSGALMAMTGGVMTLTRDGFHALHPTGAAAWMLAAVPAIPFVGLIFVAGRYLARETDEFVRMLIVQSMLWGIGATLAVETTWGFLSELAGLHPFPGFFGMVLFFVAAAVASVLLRRKYQ